jgi:predicted nucleotidyltransferase
MSGPSDTFTRNAEHDTVIYELAHFFRLACKANPTALEILFSEEDYFALDAGRALRANRSIFLASRPILAAYSGYAVSQIKKAQAGTGGSRGAEHYKRLKFKLHTLRLLDACEALLTDGILPVRHPNPQSLLLRADQPIDVLSGIVEHRLIELNKAAQVSPLPKEVDTQVVNDFLHSMRTRFTF